MKRAFIFENCCQHFFLFCVTTTAQCLWNTAGVHMEKMSHLMTKPTKWHVRPANTQISLGLRPVRSESSLGAQWVAKDPRFLYADNEDSDQTGRMPRLILGFAGRTCHFVSFVMRRLKFTLLCWHSGGSFASQMHIIRVENVLYQQYNIAKRRVFEIRNLFDLWPFSLWLLKFIFFSLNLVMLFDYKNAHLKLKACGF